MQFNDDPVGEMPRRLVDHYMPARHQKQTRSRSKKKPLALVSGACPLKVSIRVEVSRMDSSIGAPPWPRRERGYWSTYRSSREGQRSLTVSLTRPSLGDARRGLRERFGFSDFLPGQAEALAAVLAGATCWR